MKKGHLNKKKYWNNLLIFLPTTALMASLSCVCVSCNNTPPISYIDSLPKERSSYIVDGDEGKTNIILYFNLFKTIDSEILSIQCNILSGDFMVSDPGKDIEIDQNDSILQVSITFSSTKTAFLTGDVGVFSLTFNSSKKTIKNYTIDGFSLTMLDKAPTIVMNTTDLNETGRSNIVTITDMFSLTDTFYGHIQLIDGFSGIEITEDEDKDRLVVQPNSFIDPIPDSRATSFSATTLQHHSIGDDVDYLFSFANTNEGTSSLSFLFTPYEKEKNKFIWTMKINDPTEFQVHVSFTNYI